MSGLIAKGVMLGFGFAGGVMAGASLADWVWAWALVGGLMVGSGFVLGGRVLGL